jgi:uncharacterized membrane protein
MAITNPVTWGYERLRSSASLVGSAEPDDLLIAAARRRNLTVGQIGLADIKTALRRGVDDFGANRTDVLALCVIYPLVGLLLARFASGADLLPLVFPLGSGFALLGPIAAIGLYELSRRREVGLSVKWTDMFLVLRSPAIGQIALLTALLAVVFVLWLGAATLIYNVTLGPQPPVSVGAFAHDVVATAAGWAMIVLGVGVGFLFALLAMTISIVSFPMMLDRGVGLDTAVSWSYRAVRANPAAMAMWGLIVAVSLVLGSIPLLLGLAVVVPVLGHATWHMYRALIRD